MAKYKIIYTYDNEAESVEDIDEAEAERIRANGFGHYYWNDINAAVWSWDFMSEEELQDIASGEVGNCLQTIDPASRSKNCKNDCRRKTKRNRKRQRLPHISCYRSWILRDRHSDSCRQKTVWRNRLVD